MAINYWTDTTGTTTGTSLWTDTSTDTSGTASTMDYYHSVTWSTSTSRKRELLVRSPKRWSERDQEAFIRLVNKDTNTGWKITMVIRGDVLITDPSVEVVSMASFSEIMAARATESDRAKMHEFFKDIDFEE